MGFLDVGTPLSWVESETVREHVKYHGLCQLLHLWRTNRSRADDFLRWGEEVEYSLIGINNERAKVYAKAADILEDLTVREHARHRPPTQLSSDWHPEFSNHMVEAIPSPPYPLNINSILFLEPSMRLRRAKIQSMLPENKYVTSQTVFPRLGSRNFLSSETGFYNKITDSIFVPDIFINPHPRFGTLVANIKARRKAKPFILIPIYKDIFTGMSTNNKETDWSKSKDISELDRFSVENHARKTMNPIKDYIYMDCFAFGMAMSCVQTTFACQDISAARYLYDQLVVLGPIFLALTASTPYQRGFLSEYDCRWQTLEQAVDCRTEEEMLEIPKSRFSGVSLYISEHLSEKDRKKYNNVNVPINEKAKQFLIDSGMDEILATHFGHLWIRDPMVIFKEKIYLDNTCAADHFENVQSTNWNSVRFKPPPPMADGSKSPIGWRVEFRTPENQITDLDNAASVALISVLAQAIQKEKLNFYIPMSYNNDNMEKSWWRNAVNNKKFYFRKDITSKTTDNTILKLSIYEILIGGQGFKGLIPICEEYMKQNIRSNGSAFTKFLQYTSLLRERAAGKLLTCAQFLRKFVLQHPSYKKDSCINEIISHDLSVLSTNIGFGIWTVPELHGLSMSSMISQTPLPSNSKLPELSLQGTSILEFTNYNENVTNAINKNNKIQIYVKRMILLNDIDNIYTMPLGVTTRFNSCKNLYNEDDGVELLDFTLNELLSETSRVSPKSSVLDRLAAINAVLKPLSSDQVSSEDFTCYWISKEVVHSVNDTTINYIRPKNSVIKKCYLLHYMAQNQISNNFGSTIKNNKFPVNFQQQQQQRLTDDICSSDFPNSLSVECECEDVGEHLMHELSRALSLGFDTEEKLEYFTQVC